MTAPRKKPAPPANDTKKGARAGVNINAYVDEDIRTQVDAFIAGHNATAEHPASLRSTIEAALKAYLKEKGYWPPPAK